MKIFDESPVEFPSVQVTPLEEDEEGKDLLDRLSDLNQQHADARNRAEAASEPLPTLIARADELAAQSLAGEVNQEEADAAETELRSAQEGVEAGRREARQCAKAIELVRTKIQDRARTLYHENAEQVRRSHEALVEATLKAEKRASTLLRILREFEMRYARYTDSADPEPHPRYLRDDERTRPPRSLMGPAQSPGGQVYASSDATAWMQRAAQQLDVSGPTVVEVEAIDFRSPTATYVPDSKRTLDKFSDHSIRPARTPSPSMSPSQSGMRSAGAEEERRDDLASSTDPSEEELVPEEPVLSESAAGDTDESEAPDPDATSSDKTNPTDGTDPAGSQASSEGESPAEDPPAEDSHAEDPHASS